ncbi:MAG: glycine/betaine ABC transporter substrate-binding protein [delta proteobacterium ML8_F1]|nr:MAG: glycine/betaine ABC transporter substrate-binding protein [delta proteobacterium ML8_F1]
MKKRNKRIIGLTLAVVLLMGLAGCAKDESKIVLASKPMAEQYIIAEMLTLLIEARTDITVEKKLGIGGGTSNIHPGMISGEIDLYPEYTGTGWLFVLKEDLIRDPDELFESVKNQYAQSYDIHWTGLYGFNNTFGLVVTRKVAEAYGLETYSDLAKVSENLVFGANSDFFEREDGYPGLQEVYGMDFGSIKEITIGLKYDAILTEEIDVTTIYTTDGRLEGSGLVVLEDDLGFFASYYAATLIRNETLEKHPELEAVLEEMTGLITNQEMIRLNYRVEVLNDDPVVVAREYLEEKGLY